MNPEERGSVGMKFKGYYLSVTLACVVLGLLLSVQFKTQQNVQNNLMLQRSEDLATIVNNLDESRRVLQAELRDLRNKQAAYNNSGDGTEALANLQSEIEKMAIVAGTARVRGPGVVVNLKGKDGAQELGVLTVVNELWAAGAEGIAVNGYRIGMNTGIDWAGRDGGVIIGNSRPQSPPYVVTAIGDPATLESALMMTGGITDQLLVFGMEMEIDQKLDIELPPVKSYRLEQAKPVKESE